MKFLRKKQKPEAGRRTPLGEGNSKVFSYYASGNPSSSQNTGRHEPGSAQKQKPYKRLAYLPSYIALFVVIIAGLYSCWLQPTPKVVIINSKGTITRSSQDYQNGIAALWQRSILNQTKLTVHSQNIKNDILAQYGELSDVQIELPLLGRRATVIVSPARPALQFVSSNGAFYVNTDGKVMAAVSEIKQNQLQNVPLVRDESGIPADVGKGLIPASEAKFLSNLSAQLAQEGVKVDSLTLPAAAANEVDARIAGQAYFVKFSILSDPAQSVGAYQTVKAKLEASHTLPKEYVDVRVEEKVFYK